MLLLEKRLKPSGPAHLGLPIEKVRNIRFQTALKRDETIRKMHSELDALINAWQGMTEMRDAAKGTMSAEKSAAVMDNMRRVMENQSRTIIRRSYRKMWRIGKDVSGNFQPFTPDEEKQLKNMYRKQQQYFVNFILDVEHKTRRMPLKQRSKMYAQALNQAYWAGRVLADLSSGVYWRWNTGMVKSEHCGDCETMAKGGRWRNGTYSAQEMADMGIFPGSGELECCTHCGCGLTSVPKPETMPVGSPWTKVTLRGVQTSSFKGMGREDRGYLAKRAKNYRWTHKGRS